MQRDDQHEQPCARRGDHGPRDPVDALQGCQNRRRRHKDKPRGDLAQRSDPGPVGAAKGVGEHAPQAQKKGSDKKDPGRRCRRRELIAEEQVDDLGAEELEHDDHGCGQCSAAEGPLPDLCLRRRAARAAARHNGESDHTDALGEEPRQIRDRQGTDVEAERRGREEEPYDRLIGPKCLERRGGADQAAKAETDHPLKPGTGTSASPRKPPVGRREGAESTDEVGGRPGDGERDQRRRRRHRERSGDRRVGDHWSGPPDVERDEPFCPLQKRERVALQQHRRGDDEADRTRGEEAVRLVRHDRAQDEGLGADCRKDLADDQSRQPAGDRCGQVFVARDRVGDGEWDAEAGELGNEQRDQDQQGEVAAVLDPKHMGRDRAGD